MHLLALFRWTFLRMLTDGEGAKNTPTPTSLKSMMKLAIYTLPKDDPKNIRIT